MKRRFFLGLGAVSFVSYSGFSVLRWSDDDSRQITARASRLLARTRLNAGLPHLTRAHLLEELVRHQSAYLERLGGVSHQNAAGLDPAQRARRLGYDGHILGEALAETRGGPAETVGTWLEYSATRAVLLNPCAREFGLAMVRGKDGRNWWTLVVGVGV